VNDTHNPVLLASEPPSVEFVGLTTLPVFKSGPSWGRPQITSRSRWEGVRESVTVCDRGRGSRACDVTLIKFFIIHMKHEI